MGIITAFVLNYNTYYPKSLKIVDDGKNVYLQTEMNDNYNIYRFKFEGQDKTVIVDSTENIISIDTMIEKGIKIGQTYNISTIYLSENGGNQSEESKKLVWKAYTYLENPLIEYESELNIIQWEAVENADYYHVYSSGFNNDYFETYSTFIDLQSVKGGIREFYVIAKSNNEGYKQSEKSNTIEREVFHEYRELKSVEFDKESKVVKVVAEENLTKLNVYLNERVLEVNPQSNFNEQTKMYEYFIDIAFTYNGEKIIGACPVQTDSYNLYTDGTITYISQNE